MQSVNFPRYPQVYSAQLADLFERFRRITVPRFSPSVIIRRAPHPEVLAIFPGCLTPVNGHRLVGWRGETMKGDALL